MVIETLQVEAEKENNPDDGDFTCDDCPFQTNTKDHLTHQRLQVDISTSHYLPWFPLILSSNLDKNHPQNSWRAMWIENIYLFKCQN